MKGENQGTLKVRPVVRRLRRRAHLERANERREIRQTRKWMNEEMCISRSRIRVQQISVLADVRCALEAPRI